MDSTSTHNQNKKASFRQQFTSDTWKQRIDAFSELITLFKKTEDSESPVFKEYTQIISEGIRDMVPTVTEQALGALKIYVDKSSEAFVSAPLIVPILVNQTLSLPFKKAVMDILMLYIEIGKNEIVQQYLTEKLLKGRDNAQICLNILSDALHLYGPRIISIDKCIIVVRACLDDNLSNQATGLFVREQALQLLFEIYRWGKRVLDLKLSLSQHKLLERKLSRINLKDVRPQKKTRYQLKLEGVHSFDPYYVWAPIDIIEELSTMNFVQTLSQDVKFQEKISELTKLMTLLESSHHITFPPRPESLKPIVQEYFSFSDIVDVIISYYDVQAVTSAMSILRLLLRDNHAYIVSTCVDIIGLLALNGRSEFSFYAKDFLPVLLSLFSQKVSIPKIHNTLDFALKHCFRLNEAMEYVGAALGDRIQSVRFNTMGWILRSLSSSYNTPQLLFDSNTLYTLIDCISPLTSDSAYECRQIAVQILALLIQIMGPKYESIILSKVPNIKKVTALLADLKTKENSGNAEGVGAQAPSTTQIEKKSDETYLFPQQNIDNMDKKDTNVITPLTTLSLNSSTSISTSESTSESTSAAISAPHSVAPANNISLLSSNNDSATVITMDSATSNILINTASDAKSSESGVSGLDIEMNADPETEKLIACLSPILPPSIIKRILSRDRADRKWALQVLQEKLKEVVDKTAKPSNLSSSSSSSSVIVETSSPTPAVAVADTKEANTTSHAMSIAVLSGPTYSLLVKSGVFNDPDPFIFTTSINIFILLIEASDSLSPPMLSIVTNLIQRSSDRKVSNAANLCFVALMEKDKRLTLKKVCKEIANINDKNTIAKVIEWVASVIDKTGADNVDYEKIIYLYQIAVQSIYSSVRDNALSLGAALVKHNAVEESVLLKDLGTDLLIKYSLLRERQTQGLRKF